jgi:hypothetical protein
MPRRRAKISRGRGILQSMIRRDVLRRSDGYCECDRSSHEHPELTCGKPLGNSWYFHYWHYKGIATSSNIRVVCPACHRKIVSSRRKIY